MGCPGRRTCDPLSRLVLVSTSISAAVIVVPETRPATAAPKRSEPLKNPLDNWTITKPTEAPPTHKPLNPLVASAKLSSEPKPTTVVPLKPEPVRPRRRRLAVAALVISAGLLFAFRTKIWDSSPSSTSPLPAFDADSLAVVTFLDLDHSRIVELLKFDRFDTLSKTAPQPIAPPSDAVALHSQPAGLSIKRPSANVRKSLDSRTLTHRKAIRSGSL